MDLEGVEPSSTMTTTIESYVRRRNRESGAEGALDHPRTFELGRCSAPTGHLLGAHGFPLCPPPVPQIAFRLPLKYVRDLPNSITPMERALGGLFPINGSGRREGGQSVAVIVRSYVWSAC